MAYFLENLNGASNKDVEISIPAPALGGGAFDYSFDIEFELNVYNSDLPFTNRDTSTQQLIFFTGGELEIRRTAGTGTDESIAIPGGYNAFKKYRLECRDPSDGTDPYITVFVDDAEIGTLPQPGGLFTFNQHDRIFPLGNSSREGGLKYLSYTDNINAANNRYYDADASNGTGSVLPETTGNGTDGILVNFPTDDSQWVFYSTGVTGSGSHQAAVATHSASGDVGTLQVSLDLVDVSNAAAPDNTGITAVVYDAAGGTELHETSSASITSGTMVISLSSGTTANNGDGVFVKLHKAGASFNDDLNGAGRATVTIA